MKITKEYNWSRRDFCFDATCENCGDVSLNNSGYDDDYFRNTVMPDRKCKKCGESSKNAEVTTTRYNPSTII